HAPFPKLKPFGEEFAGNGFTLAGQEPARYLRETGDDQLTLMRDFPLAIRFDAYGRWLPQTARRTDLQTPYGIKLLSGGLIAKDVSYYFYFFLGERGDVAGLEDAFITFNDVIGSQLDITVGQFQASDPLFKRELRLSFEDYEVYRVRPGLSGTNLTYDRGLMFSYGLPSGTDIVFEVLNGNGIGPADASRNFDSDFLKNVMLRVSQDVGEHVRVGLFGYAGSEKAFGVQNDIRMGGPDLTVMLEPLELNVQMVRRIDDHPFFLSPKSDATTDGGFAELIYAPDRDKSRWLVVALFNYVTSDIAGMEKKTVSLTGTYLLGRNIRLMGEYAYDLELKANRLTTGIVCAF
ncbi:MAG: hypothetical protein AABY75_03995, partial [Bacteroidota bacterium]